MEKNNSVRNKDTETNYTFLKSSKPLYRTSIKFIAPCISILKNLSKFFQNLGIFKKIKIKNFLHNFKQLHSKFHEIISKNVGVTIKFINFIYKNRFSGHNSYIFQDNLMKFCMQSFKNMPKLFHLKFFQNSKFLKIFQ